MLGQLFNSILYQPLFQALVWIYNLIPDFGIAIIILTIVIKLVLYPLNQKAIKSQQTMAKLQPKLKKLQQKHKNDKTKQAQIMMEFYKENKINPFASFVPMLIQFPILIALFKVFIDVSKNIDLINPIFLGLFNLSQRSIALSVIAGAVQFWQTKSISTGQNNKFLYFMPLITVFIGLSLPAGLPLYWITITIFAIVQQKIYARYHPANNK